MMIYLITPSGEEIAITHTTEAEIHETAEGEKTLSVVLLREYQKYVSEGTQVRYNGEDYDIVSVKYSELGQYPICMLECEHISYRLNETFGEDVNAAGTPDEILERILSGTDFTGDASAFDDAGTIVLHIEGQMYRRNAVYRLAEAVGARWVEFRGRTIRLVPADEGTSGGNLLDEEYISDVSCTVNYLENTEEYALTFLKRPVLSLGDKVSIRYAPLGINVTDKTVIGLTYNPYDPFMVTVEIGDHIRDIIDDTVDYGKLYLKKADVGMEIDRYISSAAGVVRLTEALSGEFVSADVLGGYVQTSELNTSIEQYIKGEEGVASITSAVSGKFMAAPPTVSYSTPSGVTYGFTKTADGYYTSTNAGVNSSFSYGVFTFENSTGEPQDVILRCINRGEQNCDFGIVSVLNGSLEQSNTADSSGVLKKFSDTNSETPVDVSLTIPAGRSTVSFKYRKDGSVHKEGDYFKIMPVTGEYVTQGEMSSAITQKVDALGASLKLSVTNGEKSSVIALTKDGISQSAVTIAFTGEVVFKSDLLTAGSTTINGANITTGKISADRIDTSTLYAKQVLLNTDDGDYPMIASELSNNNAYVKVGVTDDNGWAQFVDIYGSYVRFARPGYEADDDSHGFVIDMIDQRIVPADYNEWWLGTHDYALAYVWARRHGFYDNTYLRVTSGELRFYYPVGQDSSSDTGYEYDYMVLAEYDDNY